MSLARGYADGMQDSRSRRSEGAATAANMRASDAERKVLEAGREAETMAFGAAMWKRKAEELAEKRNVQTSKLSGCLIVINAMIKTMESEMSPEQRERFRDQLVQRARGRIHEVDNDLRGTADFLDIEGHFKVLDQNRILGIV